MSKRELTLQEIADLLNGRTLTFDELELKLDPIELINIPSDDFGNTPMGSIFKTISEKI